MAFAYGTATRIFAVATAVLPVPVACSSGARPRSDDPSIGLAMVDSGAQPGDGGVFVTDSHPGEDTLGDQVSGDETAASDAIAADAAAADAPSEAPPPIPPACALTKSWTSSGAIASLADPTFARFGGVTPTGLTVAYTTTDRHVDVADRMDPNSDFVSFADLVPTSLQTDARAAVGASGNIAIAVAANGTDFVAWERISRVSMWATASASAFALVSMAAVQGGATISEPVLGSSGRTFFYLLTTSNQTPGLFESTWDATTNQWSAGSPVPNPELSSVDSTHRRRPTGVSSDDRTLFFFDEVSGKERAAWRAAPSAAFDMFGDISVAPEGTPDEACRVLYYQGMDADAGVPNTFTAR